MIGDVSETLESVKREIAERLTAHTAYGEPVTVDGVTVIPVARIMVGYGAGSACATWPLCRGSLLPEGSVFAVHMGHRYFAALVGLMTVGAAAMAWKRRGASFALGVSGMGLVGLFMLQILAGAATVWSGFSADMKATHLSLATLVWMSLVFMTAQVIVPAWSEANQRAPSISSTSPVEGVTS